MREENTKRLWIVGPVGFCPSVRRAMEMFRTLRAQNPSEPIYVLHELVHNRVVTEEMSAQGAIFVEDAAQVPEGAILLLSAHGCGPTQEILCRERHLRTQDATCPLVARLRRQVLDVPEALPVLFLGDPAHIEVRGILERLHGRRVYLISSEADAAALPPLPAAAFFSQTTRSTEEIRRVRGILRERIGDLLDHASPCEAVLRRQELMRRAATQCQQVYIVGSPHSSNARRLAEIARENCRGGVFLVESADEISPDALASLHCIALGSATSTPEKPIQDVLEKFQTMGFLPQDFREEQP